MKKLFWIGDSYKVLVGFSTTVKHEIGYQLQRLQQGEDPTDWKPMQTIGPGVREIRVKVDGQHRVIYLAKFDEGVYVLHAFRKKTQKTSKKDIDIANSRYRDILNGRK